MDLIGIASLLISIATLLVAINFKKKIVARTEKLSFYEERDKYCYELEAFFKTYSKDKSYNQFHLENTRLLIDKMREEYTFVSRKLRKKLDKTYSLIVVKCYPEAAKNQQRYRIPLCESINSIISLLKKEEII